MIKQFLYRLAKVLGVSRPIGIDISRYQAPQDLTKPHGINFKVLLDAVDFLFMRAGFAGSAGGAWTDPRVHEYMNDLMDLLLQNPIPFTFYWYFRDNVSIMEQVNCFSKIVNLYKKVINLPLVVDAEAFTKANNLSTQKIIDFQKEVENQTGLPVDILYGRAGQLNSETVPGLEVVLPHLWIARYDSLLNSQTGQPWVEGGVQEYVEPRDYDEWTFWQYRKSGDESKYGITAGAKGIDENVYNGTLNELHSFANLGKTIPPPSDCCEDIKLRMDLLDAEIRFVKGELGTLNQRADLGEQERTQIWSELNAINEIRYEIGKLLE